MQLTTVINNAKIVRPNQTKSTKGSIGIIDDKIVMVKDKIPKTAITDQTKIIDGSKLLAFPGVVDAHTHTGIYAPLADDAVSESKAAASGGVTTMLNYFRTGQYYLNRGGSYRTFYPDVLGLSDGNYYVDYAYHLASINASHIEEMDDLLTNFGVSSFKIFMFYGGYGLHGGSNQDSQRQFLMLEEHDNYDIAHFEMIMRKAAAAHPKISRNARCHIGKPPLRARRYFESVHQDCAKRDNPHGASRIQRGAPPSLRRSGNLDCLLPCKRN